MFQAPKLTNAGKKLYYENMAGTPIVFTTIQMGNGTISAPIASMTKLANTVITIVASIDAKNSYIDVSGTFSNAQLSEGFYWREIGVFAADNAFPKDRTRDILYCYQNAYDTADFIPIAAVETVEKNITVPMIVGDATAVSCVLSKSLVFATLQNLDDHTADTKKHITALERTEWNAKETTAGAQAKADAALEAALAADIDCGTFDAPGPVAAHNASPEAHRAMTVDGNAVAEVGGGGDLTTHENDPLAHQNIILDGNQN